MKKIKEHVLLNKEHVLLNKEHVLLNFVFTSILCVCVLWRIGRMRGYFVFFLQRQFSPTQ